MSAVVVFTGPTLSADEALTELNAEYRPPAAEGDVYRAARRGPPVIGIIDGYFEREPSVRHKEILWAMSQGIHVFGAASMGALRAAELEAFGMEGVGQIFEAYLDGGLEDDDEVAVAHGPAEVGFRAGSEAMVDIRHTLARAQATGVVSQATRAMLEAAAKSLFYPDRNYATVVRCAAELGAPPGELTALREWLPAGRSSLKHADALAMLRAIRERLAAGLAPKQVTYWFENSAMWESTWRLAGDTDDAGTVYSSDVLDELRLEGEGILRMHEAALLRALAVKHSYVQGMADPGPQRARAAQRLWREHEVKDERSRQAWMSANRLNDAQLGALLEDEARVSWIKSVAAFDASGYYLDQLRVAGDYPRLVERARRKQAALAALGLEEATVADAGTGEAELLRWYFEDRLGQPTPADVDAYCTRLGFTGRVSFMRCLAREYCFVNAAPAKAGTQG
ncbi:MAG TPA: TfuA-like protein [Candidatus Dormibacteraeota bacterium]|nr:TfuA-like protein [Candidatus Dormibacteraeota bacterium]